VKFTPLTRERLEDMTLSTYNARQRHLRRLVEALGRDHYARYHAPTEARIAEWVTNRAALAEAVTCDEDECDAGHLSGTGLCAQHLRQSRSAA
jgi:hypothetical protein